MYEILLLGEIENMVDIVALGELLIDFTPNGVSDAGNILFERNPGGAPANVLAALSKLGGKSEFIGKVGNDQFGNFLKHTLEKNGIGIKGLKFSNEVNTTLAFVHLNEYGDRSFSFYRKPGADMMLVEEDVDFCIIDDSRIFHFGSISMTDEPSKTATIKAIEYAKGKGKVISFDPNWRPPLWENNDHAKEAMMIGLKYADILKMSEIELEFLTGSQDLKKGAKSIADIGPKLIIITLGPKGCFYYSNTRTGHLNTYDTNIVDTTGAGDAFWGAFLYKLCNKDVDINMIDKNTLEEIIDFSNAAGALCATKKGAIPAMPSLEQVEACMKGVPELVVEYIE